MQALDVEEGEWANFAAAIAELATKNEKKPDGFKNFQVNHDKLSLI